MRGNEVDHHFSLLKIKESIHETKKMKEKNSDWILMACSLTSS